MGKIPNISLLPGLTCSPGVKCFEQGCYAQKFVTMRSVVKTAWKTNTDAYHESSADYFKQIRLYILENKVPLFRWHVGGDIPDVVYAQRMFSTATIFPKTKFLCFTKRYDILPAFLTEAIPENLKLIISRWPGDTIPDHARTLPMAWLAEDSRVPHDAFPCPGKCDICAMCFNLPMMASVVFKKH